MFRAAAALIPLLLVVAAAGPSATAGSWRWPVDGPRSILRSYLAPATPYSAGHRGIDIAATAGVVFAPADGVVHFSGVVVDRPVLSIRHVGGLISSYEPVVSPLVAGDVVARGDPIGTVQPGHCDTVCLHFGVRLDGQYVSPLAWLGGVPRSVLLPTRMPHAGAAHTPVAARARCPARFPRTNCRTRELPRAGFPRAGPLH